MHRRFEFSGVDLFYIIINTIGIHCATMCLIQDYMGKESYIRFISDNWININWVFWVFLLPAFIHINYSIIKKGEIKNEK